MVVVGFVRVKETSLNSGITSEIRITAFKVLHRDIYMCLGV